MAETSSQNPFSTWDNKQQSKQSRMKRKLIPKTIGLLAAVGLWAGASTSASASLTIDQIIYESGSGVTPGLMSGTLEVVSSAGNTLVITMRNTSVDAAFTGSSPSLYLLTGFGIELPGVTILSGTVARGSGSSSLFFDVGQSATDLSNQYGYGNAAFDGYNMGGVLAVDGIVSTVNNGNVTFNRFFGAPPITIDGPDYGAVSALELAYPGSYAAVRDSITFTLNLSGPAPTEAQIDAGNVVLAFGSPNAVVPEPTTMIAGALLLLPFGASTIRFFRKQRTA